MAQGGGGDADGHSPPHTRGGYILCRKQQTKDNVREQRAERPHGLEGWGRPPEGTDRNLKSGHEKKGIAQSGGGRDCDLSLNIYLLFLHDHGIFSGVCDFPAPTYPSPSYSQM